VARSERRDGLLAWGAMGLGLGLLTGFVLAEAVGGKAALGGRAPLDRIPGEQEGATLDEELPSMVALELVDRSA
jgi:hypothetical protein